MSTSKVGGTGSGPKVNLRSTAVKRIMQEASELACPADDFVAAPLETDIFEWHCTMKGVEGSEYEGGLYHLRILLPPTYPMSAPDIIVLTPNGRFELGKKICIDGLTSFHAGSWQPAWGVRTAITGLRSFWMQGGEALSAIGALDVSKTERKRLAQLSRQWTCPTCGVMEAQIPSTDLPQPPCDEKDTVGQVDPASSANDGRAGPSNKTENNEPIGSLTAEPMSQAESPDGLAVSSSQDQAADDPSPGRVQAACETHRAALEVDRPPADIRLGDVLSQRDRLTSRRPVPMWLDALIVAALAMLLLLIGRRLTHGPSMAAL